MRYAVHLGFAASVTAQFNPSISCCTHYTQFKFKVDGQWRTSPQELEVNSSEVRSDAASQQLTFAVPGLWVNSNFCLLQGHLNNFRTVVATAEVSIKTPTTGPVFVVGDWDGWQVSCMHHALAWSDHATMESAGHIPYISHGVWRLSSC